MKKNLKEETSVKPSVYVGTYRKYNEGSLKGKWLNLEDYADEDEFLKACFELHSDEEDPELMFQDYQGFPERFYSESNINPAVWEWLELDEDDRELLEVYIDKVIGGSFPFLKDELKSIDQARDAFMGKFDSEADWAQEFLDQTEGLNKDNAGSYLFVDDVTAGIIGQEDADSRVEDMSDSEVVREAGLEDEFEAAEDDEEKADQVIEDAREAVRSKIADEVESAIKKDAVGYFVDELGAYSIEDLMKASFISIDYDAYARDAEMSGDVSFVRHDGDVWVFSNI